MVENSRFKVGSKKIYTSGSNLVGPMIHKKEGATWWWSSMQQFVALSFSLFATIVLYATLN
jgi:hypothetical protein